MSNNAMNDNPMNSAARRAFIFDMDGTIVDNMGFHMTSWLEFFARRDMILDADAFFRDTAGRQSHEIMSTYFGKPYTKETSRELDDEKEALYRELYAPHLKTVAGFMDLIAKARQQHVALAVATAAPNDNITFTLDGLDLRRHFNAVVGAADVARGKPHPDVFLLAAERCGVDPSNAIVFEDAPLGVEAARRAGMRAVVLTTTLPASAFAAFDNVIAVAPDFSELDIATLFAADAPVN